MRFPMGVSLAVVFAAQAVVGLAQAPDEKLTLKIPPVKTSLDLEGQAVEITVWGSVSAAPGGTLRLAVTADLGNFQENLTPLLSAQLNRSERCKDRLSVQRAVLVPAAPAGVLTVYVHYERFGCAKAFGKEIVKRLAGGDAVVEVNVTPAVAQNRISLAAQVRRIDADGSLGELLRSGSFGDSMREKIAASIEAAIQKAGNLKRAMPAAVEDVAAIESVQFADGGAGRLWLQLTGAVHLSSEQFRELLKQ
jgi:hypothetical protein